MTLACAAKTYGSLPAGRAARMVRMLAATFVSCWVLLVSRLLTSAAIVTAERVRYFISSVSRESRFMPMRKTCETISGNTPTSTIAPSSVQSSRGRWRGELSGEPSDMAGLYSGNQRSPLAGSLPPPAVLHSPLHVLSVRGLHRPGVAGPLHRCARGGDHAPGWWGG